MIKFTMPARDLLGAFRFALSAAGVKDVRYYLNGVALELENGTARCVGTDGHRLAVVESKPLADLEGAPTAQRVLKRVDVAALLKAPKPKADDLATVELLPDGVRVTLGAIAYTLAVIPDAKYPEWTRMRPRAILAEEVTPGGVIGMNADYLADAAKACIGLANSKYHGVKVRAGNGIGAPAESGILFEPGISPADFPTLESAWVYIMPMRL